MSADRASDHRRAGLRARLAAWRTRFGDRLFADTDAAARAAGWRVESTARGLGRTYRDPRFDQLASCPSCAGSGRDRDFGAVQHCLDCAGTGRIRRSPVEPRDRDPDRHVVGSEPRCAGRGAGRLFSGHPVGDADADDAGIAWADPAAVPPTARRGWPR